LVGRAFRAGWAGRFAPGGLYRPRASRAVGHIPTAEGRPPRSGPTAKWPYRGAAERSHRSWQRGDGQLAVLGVEHEFQTADVAPIDFADLRRDLLMTNVARAGGTPPALRGPRRLFVIAYEHGWDFRVQRFASFPRRPSTELIDARHRSCAQRDGRVNWRCVSCGSTIAQTSWNNTRRNVPFRTPRGASDGVYGFFTRTFEAAGTQVERGDDSAA
jgi:hypothetical protein